jgi:hypothetical protein
MPLSAEVTYWLQTSDLLSGLPPAQITAEFFGNSTMLGQAQGTIQLGANYSDTVTLSVTPAYYTNYSVELAVDVAGFSLPTQTYPVPSLPGVVP